MSSDRCTIDQMANVIMEGLQEYADLATEDLKTAVKKAGKEAKDQVQAGAPVRTGKYKKSWATKNTKETSNSLEVTVYSKDRYQIAHLLEFGHAKRGGGRVKAIPHIASAESKAAEMLEREVERALQG